MSGPPSPICICCAPKDKIDIAEPLQRALHEKGITTTYPSEVGLATAKSPASNEFSFKTSGTTIFILSKEFLLDLHSVTLLDHCYHLHVSSDGSETRTSIILVFYRVTAEQISSFANEGEQNTVLSNAIRTIKTILADVPSRNFKIIQSMISSAPENSSNAPLSSQPLITDIVDTVGILQTQASTSHGNLPVDIRAPVVRDRFSDPFRPSFLVQKPTPFAVVNFKAVDGEQLTVEGELKRMILSPTLDVTEGNVYTVKQPYQEVISAVGQSGTGKSTALQAISCENDVQEHFVDGIYWITLGEHASPGRIIQELSDIVNSAGGAGLSKQILQAPSLHAGVEFFARWFNGRKALFILDDLWPTLRSFIGFLCELRFLTTYPGRIVLSTQFDDIAQATGSHIRFHLKDPHSEESWQILSSYIGLPKDDTDCVWQNSHTKTILDHCGGLPITLGLAGRALRFCFDSKRLSLFESVDVYATKIAMKHNTVSNTACAVNSYFKASLLVSLEFANVHIKDEGPNEHPDIYMSSEDLFAGLSVFQKQFKVPLRALSGLWSLDSSFTTKVVDIFQSFNLLSRSDQTVQIHNACSEVCKFLAGNRGDARRFHTNLLQYYLSSADLEQDSHGLESRVSVATSSSEESVATTTKKHSWYHKSPTLARKNSLSSKSTNDPSRDSECEWWDTNLHTDNHLNFNLCWHLKLSDSLKELQLLLTDARWVLHRVANKNLHLYKDDFSHVLELLRNEVNDNDNSFANQLRVIENAVSRAWNRICANPCEFQFQMFARLISNSDKCILIKRFLKSVRQHTNRPWIMPFHTCFPDQRNLLLSKFVVKKGVTAVALGRATHTLLNNQIRFAYLGTEDSILKLDLKTEKIVNEIKGNVRHVTCVVVSEDGLVVVAGMQNGSIYIWNSETGDVIRGIGMAHNGPVSCISVCRSGKRIASGSNDKRVRVWKTKNVGVGVTLCGHAKTVSCIAMSADGKRIATGSDDCTVRIWDTKSDSGAEHILGSHQRGVSSVSISTDGRWILSCGFDDTVKVWDGKKKRVHRILQSGCSNLREVGITFDALTAIGVSNSLETQTWNIGGTSQKGFQTSKILDSRSARNEVAVSVDGARIVAGNLNGELHVLDTRRNLRASNEDALNDSMAKQYDQPVMCLSTSLNGQWAVSVSADDRVVVWDLDNPRTSKKEVKSNMKNVTCVSVTNDGHRLILSSNDGTLLLWNVDRSLGEGHVVQNPSINVSSLCFSPDCSYFVSGNTDGSLVLWHTRSRRPVGPPVTAHTDVIRCITISSNGKWIVSGSADHTVRLWERSKLRELGKEILLCADVTWVSITRNNIVTSVSRKKVVKCRIDSRQGLKMVYEKVCRHESLLLPQSGYGSPLTPPTTPISISNIFNLVDGLGQDIRLHFCGDSIFMSAQKEMKLATFPHKITCTSMNEDRKQFCTGHVDGSIHHFQMITPTK